MDRVVARPALCQMFPSTEITPTPLTLGLTPTYLHKELTHGNVAKPVGRAHAA